eukprot:TRINITY_DN12218_c0_g1_i2.p1 TRINITY_DN12218_c0_g1~~TRINITY_DN12218_c0_g1_i2.p1  ORF type:complete len:299 (+),score=68.81 TRINITY_DN12218_c0_g1_i2:115-897(+)
MAPPPGFVAQVTLSSSSTSPSSSFVDRVGATWNIKARHEDYLVLASGLNDEMLEKLSDFLKRKRPRAARMKNEGAGESDDERKARYDDRDSRVSWFRAEDECPWFYERIVEIVRDVANVEFKLLKVDARGDPVFEPEMVQYAVYGPKQHFNAWHQDAFQQGNDAEDARQVAIVFMLSKRSDYTGGQFQAKIKKPDGRKVVRTIPVDAGEAIVFPAKRLVHRVLPVQTGIRKTAVFWAWDKSTSRFHIAKAKNKKAKSKTK